MIIRPMKRFIPSTHLTYDSIAPVMLPPLWPGHRAGFDRFKAKFAGVRITGAAPKPGKMGVSAIGTCITTVGICLPCLNHRIAQRRARAVKYLTDEGDAGPCGIPGDHLLT